MTNVVFDSNVIIGIGKQLQSGISKSNSKLEKQIFNIMKLIAESKLNIYVTPTIQNEISRGDKHDGGASNAFLTRFANRIKFSADEELLSYYLTDIYGNHKVYNTTAITEASEYSNRNYNDALIVAETTILQEKLGTSLILLTNNIQDMNNIRTINYINKSKGFHPIKIYSIYALDKLSEDNNQY